MSVLSIRYDNFKSVANNKLKMMVIYLLFILFIYILEGQLQHRDAERKGAGNIKRRFSIREINKTVKR